MTPLTATDGGVRPRAFASPAGPWVLMAVFAVLNGGFREVVLIGVGWTVATVGVEFLVGSVEGTPIATTLGQYDVVAGQVWILVPVALLVSPLLFGWYLW